MVINVFQNLGKKEKAKSGGLSSAFSGALSAANDEFTKINSQASSQQLGPVAPTPTFLGATPQQFQQSQAAQAEQKKFDTTLSAPTAPSGGRIEQRAGATAAIDQQVAQQKFSDIIKLQFDQLNAAKAPGTQAKEVFETVTSPFGAVFGGIGNVIAPPEGSSPNLVDRFKTGAKSQLAENFGLTEGVQARQQLGGRVVRSQIDPIQKPDLSGGTGKDIAQTARFISEIPKEIFAQSVIFGINILGDPETYVGFKGAKAADEALEFSPKIQKALKNNGVLDEAMELIQGASRGIAIENGDTSVVVDSFLDKLKNSPNGEKIMQVLGEQSSEALSIPNPQFQSIRSRLDELMIDVETGGKKAPNLGESGRRLETKGRVKSSIAQAVDDKIPTRKNITTSERVALYRSLRAQEKAANAGSKVGKREAIKEVSQIKKELSRFVEEVIPDTQITRGQTRQLIRDVATSRTPAQLRKVRERALSIADLSLRKSLVSDISKKVTESLANKSRFTAGQLQRAKELQGSNAFAVAQKERDAIASILDFVELKPVGDKRAARYKSAESFLKRNPDFKGMPKEVLEGIAGLSKKPITELSTEELYSLSQKIDEFVERGKVRSRLMAASRGRTIDQALDKIEEGSVNLGAYAKNSSDPASATLRQELMNIYETFDLNSLTTQNLADSLDGHVWTKSSGRKVGPNYEHFVLGAREANDAAGQEADQLYKNINEFFSELKLTRDEKLRIGIFAYANQPGLRRQLATQLEKRGIKLEKGFQLTTREQSAYDFMRSHLDGIKPELDAVAMETRGSRIGFIDNYFPVSRELDSFRGIEDVIEGNVRLTSGKLFKKTSEFGSLKSRKITDLADSDLDIDPVKAFTKYMDSAVFYKNWEPWLATSRALVGGKGSRYSKIVGEKGHFMMTKYVERIARRGAKENPWINTIDKVSALAKRNLAVAYMVRGATVVKQFTGGLVGGARIGHRWVLNGWNDVLTSPEMRKFAREKSLELKHRTGGELTYAELERNFELGTADLPLHKRVADNVQKTGGKLLESSVEIADMLTSQAVWIGAYKKAIAGFADGDEATAIRYADDILNQTQASGSFKDITRFQNRNETLNSVVFPFSTFVLNQWNLIRASMIQTFGKEVAFMDRAAGAGMFLSIMASVMAEQSVEFAFEDPEYRDGNIVEHWKNNLPRAMMSQVPILGNVISAVSFDGANFQPIAGREFDRITNGIGGIVSDPLKGLLNSIKGISSLAGLPANMVKDIYRLGEWLGPDIFNAIQGASQQLPDLGSPAPAQGSGFQQPAYSQPNLGQPSLGDQSQPFIQPAFR